MKNNPRKRILADVKKIVVKVGTAVLTSDDGRIDPKVIYSICEQVHTLKTRGYTVVLVSSGAIGAGIGQLNLKRRPQTLSELQATAAVGQSKLVSYYDEAFATHGYHAAQMLLTREDFAQRTRYINARNTLWALLEMGAVPIINENDSIAVDELKFGDNDMISALVTHLLQADLLILLTNVDGLLNLSSRSEGKGEVLDVVEDLNEEIFKLASKKRSNLGVGGMQSKLDAVKKALESGEPVIIANGKKRKILQDIMDMNKVGTLFVPSAKKMKSWKRWIGFAARPKGRIEVDEGAMKALTQRGKSLLASGIILIKGNFQKGDVVIIEGPSGKSFARGLINYSAKDVQSIKGMNTRQFQKVLGEAPFQEIIHRNNLVIMT